MKRAIHAGKSFFAPTTLTAIIAIAISFAFLSCSGDDGGGDGDSSSSSAGKSSSSSSGGNSGAGASSSIDAGGGYTGSYGSLAYQGQTYKTVVIGTQTWMAENLNYEADGSKCYDNEDANCNKYGKLYDWETAKTVCPDGWRLPSKEDWDALAAFVESDKGCNDCDALHLKARSGWYDSDGNPSGNGEDTYGFAALPGGRSLPGGTFYDAGDLGYWWSASENVSYGAYLRYMYFDTEDADWLIDSQLDMYSVRCLQD